MGASVHLLLLLIAAASTAAALRAGDGLVGRSGGSHATSFLSSVRWTAGVRRAAPPSMGGPPPPAWAPPVVLSIASRRLGKRFEKERCAKLWGALVAAFGDDKAALTALERDPYILDPSNDPIMFQRAKAALMSTLGGEGAALQALLKNPALFRRHDVGRLSRASIDQQAVLAVVRRADGPIAAVVLLVGSLIFSR